MAITLRIVLVENLRRSAERIVSGRAAREEADALADRLLGVERPRRRPGGARAPTSGRRPADGFAVQLVQRLRDQDPEVTPALRLARGAPGARGHDRRRAGARRASAPGRDERHGPQHHHQHAADLRRRLGGVLRERQPRSTRCCAPAATSRAMDFATRDLYRSAIEELARGIGRSGARDRAARAGTSPPRRRDMRRRSARARSRLPPDRRRPRAPSSDASAFARRPARCAGRFTPTVGIARLCRQRSPLIGRSSCSLPVLVLAQRVGIDWLASGARWPARRSSRRSMPRIALVNRAVTGGFGATLPAGPRAARRRAARSCARWSSCRRC